jgi:flagella basal body P-ring formation protein FlgA
VVLLLALLTTLGVSRTAVGADGVRSLGEAEVRQRVERYVDEQLAGSGDRWEIGAIRISGDPQVPVGALTFSVSHGRGVELAGPTVLHLLVAGSGGYQRRLRVTTAIERETRVWVAKRDLERGAVLSKADVAGEYRSVRRLPNDATRELDAVLAKQLTRSVAAGAVVRTSMLDDVPVVSRGAQVSLVAKRGALRIATPGIVREDAGAGEMVSVVNPASGKVVNGRVVDARTVEVIF